MERVTVRFTGRVQGVGFRATTRDIAANFQVTGLVRNVSDGSVTLIAEGESVELQSLLQAVLKRLERHIVGHTARWEAVAESIFPDFRIAATEVE